MNPSRILALHAFYQVPGGEDQVHRTEVAYLRERGHEVADVTVENASLSSLGRLAQVRATVSNPVAAARVSEEIARFRPDVAYVNNVFPGLSPSVIAACREAGVPVVRVLHNYRFACASGNLYRDGAFCDRCVGRSALPAVAHGCYRASRATSAVAALARSSDRREGRATQLIAISDYVRDVAVRSGFDGDRITVRPNLTLDASPGMTATATPVDGGTVMFAGRDTPEKGLDVLLDAFRLLLVRRPRATLVVVGPESRAGTPRVDWRGRLPHEEVAALMARADVVAVPSVWAEPFGLVAVEALACGTPVVASAMGGLAELAGDCVTLHRAGDAADLAASLDAALSADRAATAAAARARYLSDFAPDRWYGLTLDAFARAAAGHRAAA